MPTGRMICLLLCASAISAVSEERVATDDREFLSKAEIESTLIGRAIVSNNLATGMVSRWQFHPDGRVDFVNRSGPGRASGTWFFQADGSMCVKMALRTGCRYWFRKNGAIANANTKASNAPTVAEISFE
ncbi:hypothetical protein J7E49_12315 [Variovorax paradoxus]|nr:hypothetical protein [Variovorax paradoxus]